MPSGSIYLGAWVNPAKSGGSQSSAAGAGTAAVEIQQLPSVQSSTGRPLGILHLYSSWSTPAPVQALSALSATGAVPLLDWGCTSVQSIAAGQDDSTITAYAQALKGYAKPIFLRWFWEMNLLNISKNKACIGSAGPSGFVAAWQHIVTIFRNQGASNVAFVWCPGLGNGKLATAPYFPGAGSVDWIGADGYDRTAAPSQAFNRIFSRWYQQYSAMGKPLMVAETGAKQQDQAAYLQSLGATLPASFPAVKAVVYFDAPGGSGNYVLQGDGLTAFAALAKSSYFGFRA